MGDNRISMGGSSEFDHDCTHDCDVQHMRLVRIRIQRLSTGMGIVCICEPEDAPDE